ncbi:MAG: hypothetical protein HYT79_12540 [Elusimicrobia bacterium]|nr:hypothetical protein [Elusimicrobiota bacterium]
MMRGGDDHGAEQKKRGGTKEETEDQEKAAGLEKLLNEKKAKALGPLAGKNEALDHLLKDAADKAKPSAGGAPVPTNLKDLKKLFK